MRQSTLDHSVVTHLQQVHAAELAQVGELRTLAEERSMADWLEREGARFLRETLAKAAG